MKSPAQDIPARVRNFIIYSMVLSGEVEASGWQMQVDRARLIAALAPVRGAATLIVTDDGLSVRCANSRTDLAGLGIWASPIAADARRLRSVLGRLTRGEVDLAFENGRLLLDERSVAARQV
jgi:hypothetical protein